MAERDQPDLDRVREALREHDERSDTQEEAPPPDRREGDDDAHDDGEEER